MKRVCFVAARFVSSKKDCRDNNISGKSNDNQTIQPIFEISSGCLENPVTPVFARIQPLRCVAVMRKYRRYITAVFGQMQPLYNGWIFDKKNQTGSKT